MERRFNKIPKLHVKKGDTVKVLAGDDKNKSGRILRVSADSEHAHLPGKPINGSSLLSAETPRNIPFTDEF